MGKYLNIELVLCPTAGRLIIDKDNEASAQIVDAELDVINCEFNNDDCVVLDIKDYTYITLTKSNLMNLVRLIEKAKTHYKLTQCDDGE